MSDNPATLVERLRSKQRLTKGNSRIDTWRLYGQSADEIESLQSRNAELEGALRLAYFSLATDGKGDAGYNLQGALDDLISKDASGATQRTIERVLKQIISTQDVLRKARAQALTNLDKVRRG